MHKATVLGRRFAVGLGVAAASLLGVGGVPAQAEEAPVKQTIEVAFVQAEASASPCSGTEVWGVAAGDGTPQRQWGNYQVCRFASTAVSISLPEVAPGDDLYTRAQDAVRTAAGGTAATSQMSKCVYYMPTGPNRSAVVTYKAKSYTVKVIDHFASGESIVAKTGNGSYMAQPITTWTPKCNTL